MNRPPDATLPVRNRRTFWLIAAVCIAPIVASYAAYYVLPPDRQTNYGELLPAGPAPAITGTDAAGKPFRLDQASRRWRLVIAAPSACGADCSSRLYATRQARTIQGKDADRIARFWLLTDAGTPDSALLSEHPGLELVRIDAGAAAGLPRGDSVIYAIDPLGNLVLAWPGDPDIKALANDLARLLRASRIGVKYQPDTYAGNAGVWLVPDTGSPG